MVFGFPKGFFGFSWGLLALNVHRQTCGDFFIFRFYFKDLGLVLQSQHKYRFKLGFGFFLGGWLSRMRLTGSYLILAALFLHSTLMVNVFCLVWLWWGIFEYILYIVMTKNNDIYKCINISGIQYFEEYTVDQN